MSFSFLCWAKFSCPFKTLAYFFKESAAATFCRVYFHPLHFLSSFCIRGSSYFFWFSLLFCGVWQKFNYCVGRELYSYFIREETEFQRGEGACLVTDVMRWQSLYLNLRLSDYVPVLIVSLLFIVRCRNQNFQDKHLAVKFRTLNWTRLAWLWCLCSLLDTRLRHRNNPISLDFVSGVFASIISASPLRWVSQVLALQRSKPRPRET